MLDVHLAQLQNIVKLAKSHQKKVLVHADLIQGLKNDKHSAEFLCQSIKPDGIISTRAEVLKVAKKNQVLTIQRLFFIRYNCFRDKL